jgi:outer membrane receptor for ferrienterochelin and colicins
LTNSNILVTAAIRLVAFGLSISLTATAAAALPRAQDVAKLSLQELLDVVVSTASKFPQDVKEAPASITVITAEEIRRYGHRTLADALRSVRGFYTSYDRNYAYLGVRGFARPGDYNTRILLLLDGHRLNDGIYDMAPIGTDFPIDVSLIDRIEVIRGPGSSLYGTSAFFAVINVVTRTGSSRKGVQVEAQGGSFQTRAVSASVGRLFDNGRELLIGASTYRSPGQENLHFPEFDTGGPGSGMAIDLDDDESSNVFGAMSSGHLSVRGGAAHRRKLIPTASYGTVFADGRESTVDDRAFLNAVYDGPVGRGWSGTARLAYDYYGYRGAYPYDYGEDGIGLSGDASSVHTMTGEWTARRRVARAHLFTAGVEVRNQFHSHQSAFDIYGETLNVKSPGTNLGFYVQDEVRIFPWLLGNVGMRVDRFSTYGFRTTPRAGLVFLPRQATAIKVLYGHAFRAPNAYELYYYAGTANTADPLAPEQIRSFEIVWEESFSKHVRTAVTAFRYDAEQIIEQQHTEGTALNEIYFANVGGFQGVGIEAEVETRLTNGISARFSHAFAQVEDQLTGAPVSNSPRHLSKAGVQIPVSRLFLSVEGQYVGERLTLGGETLDGFFMPNISVTSAPERRVGITFAVYNAFNSAYDDPGAEEHLQQSIRQDGRTFLARLRVAF